MNKHPKRKLTRYLGAVSLLLPLVLLSFYKAYEKHRDTVVNQQKYQLSASADIGANYFTTYLNEKNLEIQNMFTFQQLGSTTDEAKRKVEGIIKQYWNQSPLYLDYMKFYTLEQIETKELAALDAETLASLTAKAIKSNELVIGPCVLVNSNNIGIYLFKGIFNEYGKYGVLVCRVNLSMVFHSTISDIRPGKEGYYTIGDIDGTNYYFSGNEDRLMFYSEKCKHENEKEMLTGYSIASIGNTNFLITAALPYEEIQQPIRITFYLLITISIGLLVLSAMITAYLFYLQKKELAYEMERKLKEQLHENNRNEVLGLFSRKVAHEYNNLLTPIKIYCELLEDSLKEHEPELFDYAHEINQSIDQCTLLAKDLLSYGRNHTITRKADSYNSTHCIQDAIKNIKLMIPSGITMTWTLTEEPIYLHGQPLELVQIIYNLCVNSIHALEHKTGARLIWVGYKLEHHTAVLTISDNGHGIPVEIQRRIFESSFTTKSEGKGNGLGLAIVAGIVDKYDGYIDFTSSKEEGTTFTIKFPVNSEQNVRTQSDYIQIDPIE